MYAVLQLQEKNGVSATLIHFVQKVWLKSLERRVFKFGGGSQLKSMEKVRFPCEIAGQKCFITIVVVLYF